MMHFLTGLWPLVWHITTGMALLLGCGAVWWFMPAWRQQAVIAAVAIGVGLGGYGMGVSNEEARCSLRMSELFKEVEDEGRKAREAAERAVPAVVVDELRETVTPPREPVYPPHVDPVYRPGPVVPVPRPAERVRKPKRDTDPYDKAR